MRDTQLSSLGSAGWARTRCRRRCWCWCWRWRGPRPCPPSAAGTRQAGERHRQRAGASAARTSLCLAGRGQVPQCVYEEGGEDGAQARLPGPPRWRSRDAPALRSASLLGPERRLGQRQFPQGEEDWPSCFETVSPFSLTTYHVGVFSVQAHRYFPEERKPNSANASPSPFPQGSDKRVISVGLKPRVTP